MSQDRLYSKGLGHTEDAVSVINDHEKGSHRPSGFGLCDSCDHVSYSRSKYGTEITFCSHSDNDRGMVRPNRFDPILRCVWYDEFGKLSLAIMWNMATLIDVRKKKIGFGDGETEEVEVDTERLNPADRLSRWHFID
jgi:hypothetical protein